MVLHGRSAAFVAMLVILSLVSAACSSDQVITSLEMSVSAVSVALPLIGPAAGLPAELVATIQGYLGATSQAISAAADILAGPGTDGSKAAAVTAAFAGIAAPAVPSKYQGVASAVQQVALMVSRFLANVPSGTGGPAIGVKTSFLPEPSKKHTKLSEKQRKRLAAIKAKAAAAAAAAEKGK